MATVTEIQDADASLTYTGTWAVVSSTAASGGGYQQSAASGSVSVPFTGRALYLQTITNQNNGQFTVTLDGVAHPGVYSCLAAPSNLVGGNAFGVLVPLVRNLSDTAHTLVLTPTAGTVYVDSFLAITGARTVATTGNLVCLGDGWTYGYGATSQTLSAYPARLAGTLVDALRRSITLVRKGVPGDCYFAVDRAAAGDSTRSGALYRLFSDAVPASPEFLTLLFGMADLGAATGVSVADLARYLRYALCFIEDVWDTTGAVGTPVKVAVGTPGYITAPNMVTVPGTTAASVDGFEVAASVVRSVVAQFPWCRLADVYGVMDCRDTLVYPNNQGDSGLHPTDVAHGLIAAEYARALVGVVG